MARPRGVVSARLHSLSCTCSWHWHPCCAYQAPGDGMLGRMKCLGACDSTRHPSPPPTPPPRPTIPNLCHPSPTPTLPYPSLPFLCKPAWSLGPPEDSHCALSGPHAIPYRLVICTSWGLEGGGWRGSRKGCRLDGGGGGNTRVIADRRRILAPSVTQDVLFFLPCLNDGRSSSRSCPGAVSNKLTCHSLPAGPPPSLPLFLSARTDISCSKSSLQFWP